MVDFVTGLRCRECQRAFPAEALHVCDYCFGPLEVAYDYERDRRRRSAGSGSRPGPAPSGATGTCCPVDDATPVDLGAGFTPLVRADRLAAELGPGRAVDQGRHRQPDRLVQGPGGLGGPDQGPPARLQGGRLRLDGQPGQLGGRPRRPGRAWTRSSSSRTTSRRPRSP